jgi:hypothetical protein
VCDAIPNYDMKTVLGDLKAKVGNSPIYIEHMEGTVFTMKQMITETNGKFCIRKGFSCDGHMVSEGHLAIT